MIGSMWVPNENCKIFELIIMFLAINVNVFKEYDLKSINKSIN